MEHWQLLQRQALPLKAKIRLTEVRIREWYNHWMGDVCVSFSGGKDSTVLLDIVRSLYPDVPAVFADTGLEYPEIREFVRTIDNVVWVKPKMSFKEVITKYGYPFPSKEQALYLHQLRRTKSDHMRNLRLYGIRKDGTQHNTGKISEKWKCLIDAPFCVSSQCCDILKKQPLNKYVKSTGRKPFIGSMAQESRVRKRLYLEHGCNAFNKSHPSSQPLSFWLDSDVWDYIRSKSLPYATIYDKGEKRTGCIFCLFGLHMEPKDDNRFTRLEKLHPKLYDYCMRELGIGDVLKWLDSKGLRKKK